MRHKLKLLNLILVGVFIFSFTACTTPKTATETTTAEETITETVPIETVPETTIKVTGTVDDEIVQNALFWEIIIKSGAKDYSLWMLNLDYMGKEIEILSDFVAGSITRDEEISRYSELSYQISTDSFLMESDIYDTSKRLGLVLNGDMENVVQVTMKWLDNVKKQFEYQAKYLDTNQAAYDIEVGKLKNENEGLLNQYQSLVEPYVSAYKKLHPEEFKE